MPDVEIYNGSTKITDMSESGQKTLKTGEKYTPNDIVVKYTKAGGLPDGMQYLGSVVSTENDGTYGGFYVDTTEISGYINKYLYIRPKVLGSATTRISRGMIVRWTSGSLFTILYLYANQSGNTSMVPINSNDGSEGRVHIVGGNMYRLKRGSGETINHITFDIYLMS